MPRRIATTLAALVLVVPLTAQAAEDPEALFSALGMPEIIEVMREEGLGYGESIRTDLLGGRGGAGWAATVSDIYDAGRMREQMLDGFESRLEGVDLDPLFAFFESERGRRIVELEVSARRALLDDDIEAAAEAAAATLDEERPDRHALIGEFVEVNDLVESNVMGAMNANYAFFMGLMAGDALGDDLSEQEILSDVWSQEGEIRADTEQWVYAYLTLAYDPLSDEDIAEYIAVSRTAEGRALNRALFGAFDDLFVDISRRLGQGAAGFLAGEEL